MAGLDDSEPGEPLASIDVTTEGAGALLIRLAGEVDVANVPGLRAAVDARLEQDSPTAIIFELSDLTFIDSSGLALLIGVANQVEHVEVRNPSATVRRVIELSGLTQTLPIGPSSS